jgi:ATP-dependent Clp protease, protease subunit
MMIQIGREGVIMANFVPMVIERSSDGERSFDIFSRLLQDRIIMLTGEVNEHSMNLVNAQLLYLDSLNANPINFYIDSGGGLVTAGLGTVGIIRSIASPVHSVILGQAASMGSILATVCSKRYAMPTARLMLHQPSGGARGMQSDIERSYKEITRLKEILTQMYVDHNTKGKTYQDFETILDRDYFMDVNEAIALGIIDEVIPSKK